MRSVVRALLLVGLCYLSVHAARPKEEDLGDATVEIQEANHPDAEKTLPEKLVYSVVFDGGKRQQMQLKKQGTLSELSVHVIGPNGVLSKLDTAGAAGEEVAFYVDRDAKAAVTLSVPRTSGQKHHNMEGTFYHDGGLYSISHRGSNELGVNAPTGFRDKGSTRGHRVSRVILGHEDSDSVDLQEVARRMRSVNKDHKESVAEKLGAAKSLHGLRKRRQAKTPYTVDMMYISDYYMYQRIQSWLAGTNLPSTPTDVAREVAIILATAANQVNLIYSLINTPTWSVKTNLAAIYVMTAAGQSSWQSQSVSTANANGILTMEIEMGLSNLTSWLDTYLSVNTIVRADHTALFTGYDIYTVSANVPYYGVCGYAYVGAACTSWGNAVVELLSFTLLGQVHAHELGHSLNASHDGSGANTACDPNLGYVMAPSQPSPSTPYYDQFSTCSLGDMGTYLASHSMCFTSALAPYNTTALQPAYGVPLGMRYTVHDQCRMQFGNNYRACGGASFGQQVCNQSLCYDTTKAYVSWFTAGRALDGTPCGNRKWCVQGSCVSNSSAPAGSDTCPLGDLSPNVPIYTNSPLTCSTLQARDCYDASTADSCCARCGSLYNASSPTCPYGDHQDCTGLWPYNCNTADWNTTCCSYCASKRLSIPGCPYGDYYTNCGTNVKWFCANYRTQCCQTCANVRGK